jgi:hypothetical protein
VNGRGVIWINGAAGAIIQLYSISVSYISLNFVTNGSISITGTLSSLVIDGGVFSNIGVGTYGGAIYLNVVEFVDSFNSVIQSVSYSFCGAVYGGGLYIAGAGILLYDNNFTNNSVSETGVDIYENKTSSLSFYSASTVQLCCSDSEGVLFALADGSNLNGLLPECIPPSGERYLSSTIGDDTQNQCLNIDLPCATLANAIARGQASLEETISVTLLGEFQDDDTTISTGEVIHIHGPTESQGVKREGKKKRKREGERERERDG